MKNDEEPAVPAAADDGFAAAADDGRQEKVGWRVFARRLARYLDWMHGDRTMVLQVAVDEPADGAAPYVQFAELGPGMIRAEVSSNTYLAAEHRLDDGREFLLRRMGWQLESRGNWFIHAEQGRTDEVAELVVRVLREVFAVESRRDLAASHDVMVALGIVRLRGLLDDDLDED